MKRCSHLVELKDRFSAFILDQWGVLHDGREANTEAIKSIDHLKDEGLSIAVLTNSGKSYRRTLRRLAGFGYRMDRIDLVLTSGDVAIDFIRQNHSNKNIFWIDERRDSAEIADIGSNAIVDEIGLATLIYLSGWSSKSMNWQKCENALARAVERQIPMICSNPDIEGFSDGEKDRAPGWVAMKFAEMGGEVELVGKPDRAMFDLCLLRLGIKDRRTAIVVGDSYRTDICGAANAGIASLLIESGLHKHIFERGKPEEAVRELSQLYSAGTVMPDYVMHRLR